MKMLKNVGKLKIAAVTAVLFSTVLSSLPASAEQWRLMSRHGDCFEIATLKRKVADLGDIRDPEAFVSLLRQKGYQVQAKEIMLPNGRAMEVTVPMLELGLMFVEEPVCKEVMR